MSATIWVKLLDEGTEVWAPATAREVDTGVWKIVSFGSCDETDNPEFSVGNVVRAELRSLSEGESLVATSKVN